MPGKNPLHLSFYRVSQPIHNMRSHSRKHLIRLTTRIYKKEDVCPYIDCMFFIWTQQPLKAVFEFIV